MKWDMQIGKGYLNTMDTPLWLACVDSHVVLIVYHMDQHALC